MTLTSRKYFLYLSSIGKIISIWPPKKNASQTEILFYELKWWFCFTSITGLMVPLLLGVFYFRNDTITVTKTLSELTALTELFVNMIQCKIQSDNFQAIFHEVEHFIENTNEYEEEILQKYIDRYKGFQLFVGSSFISTAILFSCIPIVTSQTLPADAWYPFATDLTAIRFVLYATQVLSIFQTGLGIAVDFAVAMVIWYSAVRTELLEYKVNRAMGTKDLKSCAHDHRRIITLTNTVKIAVKFIILKTNLTMISAVVCGAFQLINHQPFEVLIRFILMVIAGCLRLYATAKPADDLKNNFERLAYSAFQTALRQERRSDAKVALMLATHCQKPMVISVTGAIKAYTLQYYASFLSTTVSYFVNLRAILED